MAQVIAVTTGTDADGQVRQTAAAVAGVIGGEVRPVSIDRQRMTPQAAAAVLRALREPRAALGVLASDRPSRRFWLRVVRGVSKPVVLVPAAARGRPPGIRRVLLPLDGTPESAAAVAETVDAFGQAGVEFVALHVFDERTVPRFWDQPAHADQAWTQEFLARNCARPGIRLITRSGVAGEHVVDVAAEERADLIALGWSRHLDPGRARTVRRTVQAAAVPVLLVPLVTAGKGR